jgi:hypothetical protein
MKYFLNINSLEELKKQFREYCQTMHPDKGGNAEDFKSMLNEYEQAAKNCGAWTKETREEVQGLRRGLRVVFFGPGMMQTRYIITSVQGEDIKLVRLFSHDFRSLEDVENYLGDEWGDEYSRRELNKYDHIRPLSKKFGIGYYWDDEENKVYTDQEISEAERIADNFDRWAANWKANKEEEERRAQEEADRKESAIIAEWSRILEELPKLYQRAEGLSWYDMTAEQREAERNAKRKNRIARMAAFKRNLKAVFNHFWPGVKCSFKISQTVYGKAQITWYDGPTVAEVKACEVFDYFRAYFFECDQFADYGDVHRRAIFSKFREMFGAFDCDGTDYERKFTEETADKVRQIIAENFPAAEELRKETEGTKSKYQTFSFSIFGINDDLFKLKKILGLIYPETPDFDTATEEEIKAYYKKCEPCDDLGRRVRNCSDDNKTANIYYSTLLQWFQEFYKINKDSKTEKTTQKAPATDTTTEAPTEGLQLVEIAEGVAVVGDSRTTYRNRKAIKAHGATWSKEAQQWQATEPEAVARLREWFGMAEPETDEQPEQTHSTESDTMTETADTADTVQAEDEQADTATNGPVFDAEGVELLRERMQAAQDRDTAAGLERLNAAFSAIFRTLSDAVAAAQAETDRTKKADEVRQLREEIDTLSAEIAGMTERLQVLAQRLAELEAEQPDAATGNAATAAEVAEESTTQGERVDRLDLLRNAAEDIERKTADNDHTGATLATLYALAACGVQVADLVPELHTIEANHRTRGYITPEEKQQRQAINDKARQRAAEVLTPEEWRTLYNTTHPKTSEAA